MQSSPAPLPALLPDYEREKLNAEMLLNKAAYGACLQSSLPSWGAAAGPGTAGQGRKPRSGGAKRYTSQYHHGENMADATPDQIDPTELTGFTKRTLCIVNALQA
ncbi:hypothetical protein ABLE93_26590 [Xanthobacter sp. KR7-65]|uniref:hypothetical protein n=1 Tax=Xanthobacter sp. KR7-65 TaxID=3156612 RepID=UPI0032B5EC22